MMMRNFRSSNVHSSPTVLVLMRFGLRKHSITSDRRSSAALESPLLLRASVFSTSIKDKLECESMLTVMAALPNVGGALCSTPQTLADAHYSSAVQ